MVGKPTREALACFIYIVSSYISTILGCLMLGFIDVDVAKNGLSYKI